MDSKDSVVEESKKSQLRKIIREDSKWSFNTILVTALTGVTVAIISTQLTGWVSSLVLIAIMAFISASVSEVYRIFVALTSLGAKKAAAPLLSTQEEEPVKQEVGVEVNSDPITDAISAVTRPFQLSDLQNSYAPEGKRVKRGLFRFKNYTKANPFLLLIFLFVGVSLTTLGVTYIVSNGNPKIVKETVTVSEEISNTKQEELIEAAVKEALAKQAVKDAEEARLKDPLLAEAAGNATELDTLKLQMATMGENITTLQNSLETVEADRISESDFIALQETIKKLEAEKTSLEEKVAELEKKIATQALSN